MFKGKNSNEKEMTFLDHLEVLRWHIVRSAIAVFLFMIIAFLSRDFIFSEIILKPKNPEFITNRLFLQFSHWLSINFGISNDSLAINTLPLSIVNIDMAGQFISHIKISIIAGIIIASPYILFELWKFVKPALHEREQRYARGAVFYISILFFAGVLFGYYLIAPLSVHFLGSYFVSSEVTNTIKLSSYISTITSVTFASGVIFELPVIILFLSKAGIVTAAFMRKYRRHSYIVLLILAAIITPPDVFSQLLVCVPLVILYEISVFISRSVEKKKMKMVRNDEPV
jgi:sec-independent protein translocase protein TatC